MTRPFVIQAAQFRATWLVIGLLIGTLVVATASALAAAATRPGLPSEATTSVTRQHPGYGTGYPLHYGLAGPSWARFDQPTPGYHPGYGTGYPLHGGLAGPSAAGPEN
jgi:hypothetical protein